MGGGDEMKVAALSEGCLLDLRVRVERGGEVAACKQETKRCPIRRHNFRRNRIMVDALISGSEGYPCYRIPALLRLPTTGLVMLFAEGRRGGDRGAFLKPLNNSERQRTRCGLGLWGALLLRPPRSSKIRGAAARGLENRLRPKRHPGA